jgi:hypothetical protein
VVGRGRSPTGVPLTGPGPPQVGQATVVEIGAWNGYQAWVAPQWGQATVVDTGAWNTYPHAHAYEASSIGPPASRTRALATSVTSCGRGSAGACACVSPARLGAVCAGATSTSSGATRARNALGRARQRARRARQAEERVRQPRPRPRVPRRSVTE